MNQKELLYHSLNQGDVFETTTSKQYVFIQFGRGTIIGKEINSDKHYRIRQSGFRDIISRAPIQIETSKWYDDLEKGDYFYVVINNKCVLLVFESINKSPRTKSIIIKAKNPHDSTNITLKPEFMKGKKLEALK